MEARRAKQSYRGNVTKELHSIATKALVDAELESVTLFKLLRAFERIVERFEYANPKTVHQIVQFSYTIEGQQEHIFSRIQGGRRATFTEVFSACRNSCYCHLSGAAGIA